MSSHKHILRGQSVIEVLVAATLIAVAFVSLFSLNNHSIKTSTYSRNQTTATTYSNQAAEWLRSQRALIGWEAVASKFDADAGGGTATYCLPTLPVDSASFLALTNGECATSDYIPNTSFLRTIKVDTTNIASNTLAITINTTWSGTTTPGAVIEISLDKTQ